MNRIGFGGAPIGGLFRAVPDLQAHAALAAAWDAGIRYFDTAPLYGFGLSEQRLGRFLDKKRREAFTISTKVGRVLVPREAAVRTDSGLAPFEDALPFEAVFDFSPGGIEAALRGSLKRLQLDFVDIAFLHDPDDHLEEAAGPAYATLCRLRDAGFVREIGAGANNVDTLANLVRQCALDVVMIAGRYTLLDQSALDVLLPVCAQRGVRVVAAGVFNSGILAQSPPQSGARYDYRAANDEIVSRARRLDEICLQYGVSLGAAAIQLPLAHPAISSVVLGMRSARELQENAEASMVRIPHEFWDVLRDCGLLRRDAPLPAALEA